MLQWLQQCWIFPHLFLSVLSIIFVVLLFECFSLHRYTCSTKKLNLPPSPWKLPIIGNLHQIGSLPHRSLASLARRHGDLMLLHFGQKPVLIVSSADAAKVVMQTQDAIFASRPKHNTSDRLIYSSRDLAFSPYGPYWKQMKKIAVLNLLNASRVDSYRSIREEEAEITINKIRQSSRSSSSFVNLSELIPSFTNNVVCRVTLGRKFEGDADNVKFWEIITEFMFLLGTFNIGDYIPWLAWMNRFNGINARVEKNKKDLDCIFESVIQDHVQPKPEFDTKGKGVQDFTDVLLGIQKEGLPSVCFDKDSVKAMLLDMFTAGTDTSSVVTIWAMAELVKYPEMMKDVQTEVRGIVKGKSCVTEDDLGQMRCLKMVIKETLRLHTPAPLLLPRELTQDTKLQGYDIPAKTTVFINAWAVGRDPVWWEDPDEFRPQRFLNTSLDYKGYDFGAMPFGGGRRGCPGVLFAALNMEVMLASLLYHFDWNLPCGNENMDMAETPGAVACMKSPLLLVATPGRV